MGMSGEEYDRSNSEYQPNKDKRMAEWRAKKKKEKEEADKRYIERYYNIIHGREEEPKRGPIRSENPRQDVFHESHGKDDQKPWTLFPDD